jgi:hypothetical protein
MMKLYDQRITILNGEIKLSVSIESDRIGHKELWFSTPEKYDKFLCKSRMDGFLVGMLFPAMQYGEDIHVSGCVSEKLLFNLNNNVIPLLKAFSPSSKIIKITASETNSSQFNGKGIGTSFSGGVDSFCTIYDYFEKENSPAFKINSLLFLNVGSHGYWGEADQLELARKKFLSRFEYLKKFSDEIGLDFISLDSNLHDFHPWGHQKTHTLTSASGVLILQKHFSKYYYSSSGVDYSDLLKNAPDYVEVDIGEYCDPILLPLLSTEDLEFLPIGCAYTRTEKINHILSYEPVQRYLNVCTSDNDDWKNCSTCSKCCRTLMTLNSLGKLEQFKNIFDIDKYKNKAERNYACLQVVHAKIDPFARGNVNLARQRGVKLPPYIYCYIVNAPTEFRRYVVQKIVKPLVPPSIWKCVKRFSKKS